MSYLDNDTWKFAPPVVGVLVNGNDRSDIRWTVEELEHKLEANQMEYLNIHSVNCGRGVLEDGKLMCVEYNDAKKQLME